VGLVEGSLRPEPRADEPDADEQVVSVQPSLSSMNSGPEVLIELRPSDAGCYVKATIEGAPDKLPRTFVGAARLAARGDHRRHDPGARLAAPAPGRVRLVRQSHFRFRAGCPQHV